MSTRRANLLLAVAFMIASVGIVSAQKVYDGGCKRGTTHQFSGDMQWMASGVVLAPRRLIKPSNLKWEIPVLAATAVMVNVADTPASRQINNLRLERDANTFSNIGVASEWGLGGTLYALGCAKGNASERSTGLQALEAGAAATGINALVKIASNRVRPDRFRSQGNFWDAGGRSFASGHAAMSFALATVMARHAHKRWEKIALYGLAGAVSFSRFAAKKHFLSDIMVGSTIGYVTGTFLTDSPPQHSTTASGP